MEKIFTISIHTGDKLYSSIKIYAVSIKINALTSIKQSESVVLLVLFKIFSVFMRNVDLWTLSGLQYVSSQVWKEACPKLLVL